MLSRLWRYLTKPRWGTGGGSDPSSGDCRADLLSVEARYAGLESEQIRQFKQLQDENTKLKRLVADLSLHKVMLQDVFSKNF